MCSRPATGGWSVAEILDHVNATNRLYLERIGSAVAEAQASGLTGDGEFRISPLERLFVWMVGPPARMKVKAPAAFQPCAATDADGIVAEWERLHDSLSELGEKARGLHLTRIRVASPASDKIRMSLLAAFHLIVAHDRRHLWQIRRMRQTS